MFESQVQKFNKANQNGNYLTFFKIEDEILPFSIEILSAGFTDVQKWSYPLITFLKNDVQNYLI